MKLYPLPDCLLLKAILFILLFTSTLSAQSKRQAGAADLDAWSREATGAAGTFTNPDTSDWIPYLPGKADVEAGGILDASHFIDAPSGKHGFLKEDGQGGFIFEDGTPVRFLGGQINPFPEKEQADWIVKWMRRHGLNYARSHGFGLPSPENWDKLDYLIAQCKKAGIYLVLTPVYWTEFDVIDPAGHEVRTSSHIILFFNSNMETAVRELWTDFYTHKNPYTGLRYADDPTLASFEFKNEDSAFWALNWVKRDLPIFWDEIRQQYSDFLKQKYGSTEVLRKAWALEGYPTALRDGERLEQGMVEIFEMAGWHEERTDQDIAMRLRKSDQTEFLHKKQTEFYERSYRFLRELGCKQAICGSNWRGHSYSMRFVLEADSHMDYLDQHDYFDHPQGGWRTDVAVQHNQSMLKSPQAGLIGNLAPRQVLNKPYTVSEWNIGSWNEHVMEASFAMIPVGLAQGWDGLIHFVLLPREIPNREPTMPDQFFNVSLNPSVVLQYPTLARVWHRGDVAEAEPVFIRRISTEQLYMPSPIPSRFFPEAFMLTHSEEIPKRDEYGHMLAVVGKVGNEFVEETLLHFEAAGIEGFLDQDGRVARSINGELLWDWGQGYLRIDTPKTQAVCGYIGDLRIETKDTQIESDAAYGSIFLTTLNDDKSIRQSDRLLLTGLGRARNTGTVYGNAADRTETTDRHATHIGLAPEHRVAVLELGELPIITEPMRGRVTLELDEASQFVAYALNDLGRRLKEVPVRVQGPKLVVDLPGTHACRFIELVKQ